MHDDVRVPFRARPRIRDGRPTAASSSIAWWSTASGLCAMFVAALVIVVCPAIRTANPAPTLPSMEAVPLAAPSTRAPIDDRPGFETDAIGTEAIDALTARLTEQRARAALPRSSDLTAIRTASGSAKDLAPRPASDVGAGIDGEQRDTASNPASDESPTVKAVALGASNAGWRGGLGAATVSGAGSSATTAAVISGRGGLATHAGFTVAHHTTRTGTIHVSVRPPGRPG